MKPQKSSKNVGTQTENNKCCCVKLAKKFGIDEKFPCLNKIEEKNYRSETPVRMVRPDSSMW